MSWIHRWVVSSHPVKRSAAPRSQILWAHTLPSTFRVRIVVIGHLREGQDQEDERRLWGREVKALNMRQTPRIDSSVSSDASDGQ